MENKYYSTWPRTDEGLIFFKSTDDALFFAAQVYRLDDIIFEIIHNYFHSRMKHKFMCRTSISDMHKRLDVFCAIQFYRECLDEIMRLIEVHC